MMLPVCAAAPICSAHQQISFYDATKAFYPLRKALEGRRTIEDRSLYCIRDGSHVQDVSFKAHATNFPQPLIFDRPSQPGSSDSFIFSPYPNEFDDIVRGFSGECIESEHGNLTCSVREINGFYPLTEDITFAEGSNASGFESQPSTYIEFLPAASPTGDELQNMTDSFGHSLKAITESRSSGSSLAISSMTSTFPESQVVNSDPLEVSQSVNMNPIASIESFIAGVTESVQMSIDRAEDAVKNTYNTFTLSISDSIKSISKSFDDVVTSSLSSIGNSKGQPGAGLTGFSTELKETINRTGTVAIDILRQAIYTAEDSLAKAATFVVYSYGSAKSLLPSEIRNVLNLSEEKTIQILQPVGTAFQQAHIVIEAFEKSLGLDPSDPLVPFILILGSSTTIGISYWLFKYGGYAGDLAPETTLELLKNEENAVLIDIRPEDLRQRDGIPDLRRRARSKYASVTLPELDGSQKKLLKSGKEVDDALIAVIIRNLKIVKDGSKVIVMDAAGSRSKSIARSLKKLGMKEPYLVHGGFKSWMKKGLRIKELKPETTLTILNEEAEAILEDIRPTPSRVTGYGLGILVAIYAIIEWEKTLQIIGIIGLVQTLYRRFSSYEDSKDFKQDLRLLVSPVKIGAEAISWAAGKLEPNKIGLPTSPSSTAVQDRVLQAAAKHESQPPDADDNQGLPREPSSQTNENLDLSEA